MNMIFCHFSHCLFITFFPFPVSFYYQNFESCIGIVTKNMSLYLSQMDMSLAMASIQARETSNSATRNQKKNLLIRPSISRLQLTWKLNWWTGQKVSSRLIKKMKLKLNQKHRQKQIICFSHLYLFPVTCSDTTQLDTTAMLYITQFRVETTIKWTNEMYRI